MPDSAQVNVPLLELAERCEQAAAKHTSWLMKDVGALIYDFGSDANECRRFYRWISQGAYLEAAMTLVPEGWRRSNLYEAEPINRSRRGWLEYATLQCRTGGYHIIVAAATPALALCAASLRARASGEPK